MLDDLDEYVCPICGQSNETCRCDDIDCSLDADPEDMYFSEPDSPQDEVVCYFNGKPLRKGDIDNQFM